MRSEFGTTMSEVYSSTKGLSVFNVLALSRQDLPRAAIDQFLRSSFDQNLPEDYVDQGVEYLLSERLAIEEAGVLKIQRFADGRAKPVLRSSDDRALVRGSY
jgi:hypothetical protein